MLPHDGDQRRPVTAQVVAEWLLVLAADGLRRGPAALADGVRVVSSAAPARVVDAAVVQVLRAQVDRLWTAGWLPVDLYEVTRRQGSARAALVAVDAMADAAAQYPAATTHPRWLAQLDEVGAERWWDSAVPYPGQWAARHDADRDALLAAALELVGLTLRLPALQTIVPPPGQATSRPRRGGARAEGEPTSQATRGARSAHGPGNGRPGADSAGVNDPGNGRPGADSAGINGPGNRRPGADSAGVNDPGNTRSAGDSAGVNGPGNSRPAADGAGVNDPRDDADVTGAGIPGTDDAGAAAGGSRAGSAGDGDPRRAGTGPAADGTNGSPRPHPSPEKVLGRVRALLAKAESTPYPEEAEALSAKAQELMSRYSIEQALADAVTPERRTAVASARRIWLDAPYLGPKTLLVAEVGSANHCRTVSSEKLGFVTVLGTELDLDVVEVLSTSLLVQAARAMLASGSRHSRPGTSRLRSFRHSFLLSYATRIGERLRDTAAQTAAAAGTDLVPVFADRSLAVNTLFDSLFTTTVRRSFSAGNAAGWGAGRSAADRAVLTTERRAVRRSHGL